MDALFDPVSRDIASRFDRLKARYANRDVAMYQMKAARSGDIQSVFPKMFPSAWPKPIIANLMDVAARDVAEMLAPLPAINCSSGAMTHDTERKFADRKTQIAYSYVTDSRLAVQMYDGADGFATYGFMPIIVEPDFKAKAPRIRIDDPMGAYPEWDRFGNLVAYARRIEKTVGELCALYPEHAAQIRRAPDTYGGGFVGDDSKLELVQWQDDMALVTFLPSRKGHVLSSIPNRLSRIPVTVPRRPGLSGSELKGEFDEVLWVWLARARFALLALEGATKAVEAPLAVPADTQDIALGPDALIRTNSPEKVRRVPLEMPQSAFAEQQTLEREARVGARYPEGRTGSMDASIITGRGVQELQGGFDSRIRAYQTILAEGLRDAIAIAFEMDQTFWPKTEKSVRGTRNGAPYQIKYTPAKDIRDDFTVDVQYGLMAGLDPNRAMVFGLQARGDKLISRDFLRRQMPWELDVTLEEQRVDIEELRDYLMQGIAGTVQAMPIMVQQGADPTKLIQATAKMIDLRRKGKSIEEACEEAFEPEQPPAPEEAGPGEAPLPGAGGPPSDAAGGQLPPGMGASGLMSGVAPGQAGMAPGGRPSLQYLLAGMTGSGQPNLQANVVKRIPT